MTQTVAVRAATRPPTIRREVVERVLAYLILAAAAVWVVSSLANSPSRFISSMFDGLGNGALYALVALGYTLVYGIIELINFAHGDLFMIGTLFSAFMISNWLGVTHSGGVAWLALALTLVLVMAFCASLNVGIEFFAYRRLRKAPKLAPLITAVGISFILQFVGQKWNGSGQRSWKTVLPSGGWEFNGVRIDYSVPIVFAVTIPLLVLMSYVVTSTRQGKAMRATAQDQDAARLMGIDVNRTISFTFAIGGALAGAAGLMYQQSIGTTRFDAGFQLGLIAFTAAVLGGIGNLTGAVIGGILIGLVQGLNDGAAYGLTQRWSQTVVFTVLILLMVFKPEGLLGKPTTEKV